MYKGTANLCILNTEDYPKVRDFRWRIRPSKYGVLYAIAHTPTINGVRHTVRMHRLVLGLTDPALEADHEDRNGLNNRRNNLKIVTKPENVKLAFKRRRERNIGETTCLVPQYFG